MQLQWLGCKDVWGCLVKVNDDTVDFELLVIDHFYEGEQQCKLYSENLDLSIDVLLPDTVGLYENISLQRLRQ